MAYGSDLSFNYSNPTKVIFEKNAVKEAGIEVEGLGGSKAMIITDKGIVEAGLIERVEKALGKRYTGTYDGCIQDSGAHIVNEAAEAAKEAGADILVSVGGGSVIDTAKGVAILLKEGGKMEDYDGMQFLFRPQTPHIVIPTTAGTGSEATYAAVIKDWDRNMKKLVVDYNIIPNIAILDPMMTVGLPPHLTSTTGMDAFTHAVEAIHSQQAEPIADALALHAIRLITQYLPVAVEKGGDVTARGQMLLASYMAGVAFGNAQVGMVHAMAHSVGALYGVPHGLANSICLPHAMMFNLDECPGRYALVAQAMGLNTAGMSDEEAGKAAVDAIQEFTKSIGIPQRLRDVNVPEEGLEEASMLCLSDGAIVYNPKFAMDYDLVLPVFKNAW